MSQKDSLVEVFGGVDTHRDCHVAAAVDTAGRVLGTAPFPADATGFEELGGWLRSHVGTWCGWGGRHGQLRRRPDPLSHRDRYRGGRSQPSQPSAAPPTGKNRHHRRPSRLGGPLSTVKPPPDPKPPTDWSRELRMLRVVRRSAIKARTQAINQLHALVVTAPEQVKHQLRGLSTKVFGSEPVPGFVPAQPIPPPRSPRKHCAIWRAAARRSPPRSKNSTKRSLVFVPEPTRRCSPPRVSVLTRPPLCWSQQETTPIWPDRRSVFRSIMRRQSRPGLLRADHTPPAQQRRRPPSQQRCEY